MMRVSCTKDLFQFKILSIMVLNIIICLQILKFVLVPDPCPELRLVYVRGHLTSPAAVSKTDLFLFPPKSVPPKASASQLMETPAFQFKNLGVILDCLVLYRISVVLANSVGSTFRIYPGGKKNIYIYILPFALLPSSSKPPASLA